MSALKRRTHSVRLSDGSAVEVDDKTAWGIKELLNLVDRVALGRTQTFALLEARQSTPICTVIFTQGGERLADLGDKLLDMSTRIHKLGSAWEGDAPSANRSMSIN